MQQGTGTRRKREGMMRCITHAKPPWKSGGVAIRHRIKARFVPATTSYNGRVSIASSAVS